MGERRQRLSARIVGRVQGVGFRWATIRQATALGLEGWVMNADDERSVEVLAEGEPGALDRFEDFLRTGPPGARVDRVDAQRSAPTGEFSGFGITRP